VGFADSIVTSIFCMVVVFTTLVVIQYLVVLSSMVIRSIEGSGSAADPKNQGSK